MRNLSLSYFDLPQGQNYHIYRICGSEVSQQPHTHEYFQICYVERGHIVHLQQEEVVDLRAGDAFIVPPGFVHTIRFPDPDAQVYSLSFQEDLFHPGFSASNVYSFMTALCLQKIPVRMRVSLDPARRQTVHSLMDALIREQDNCPDLALTAAGSLVASVMCVLSQAYASDDANREPLQAAARYAEAINCCIAWIDGHFTQDLTLNDLCHRFALSRTQFSALFPRFAGTTLKRYIAQKRIGYAVVLLGSTDFSIQQIAEMSGYSDISTFYRNFTKITGVQPSAYRPG